MDEAPRTKVLLVDDELGKGKAEDVMVEGLRSEGFDVQAVETAEEALAKLEEAVGAGKPFRVAVLDLNLESSGWKYKFKRWALPNEVGERWPDTARIIVSGVFVADVHQVEALRDYGEEFINKEWLSGGAGFEVLAQRIRTLIRIGDEPPPGSVPEVYLFRHKDAPGDQTFPTGEQTGWFAFDPRNRTLATPGETYLEMKATEAWALEVMVLLTALGDGRRLVRYEDFAMYRSRIPGVSRPDKFLSDDYRINIHRTISSLRKKVLEDRSKSDDLFRSRTGDGYYFDAVIQVREST